MALEPLVRSFDRTGIQLVTELSRREGQAAVDGGPAWTGDQQDGHAVGAGYKESTLKYTAGIGPVDGGLAGLKIHRPHVVGDLLFGILLDAQVKGRDKGIRIHKTSLL